MASREEKEELPSKEELTVDTDKTPTMSDTEQAGDEMAVDEQQTDSGAVVDFADNSNSSSEKRRVFVGNLSWKTSWQDLKDYMSTAGLNVIRADVLINADGRSRGCAIVEFATPEEAAQAVLTLNDSELDGRQIFVREDREDRVGHTPAPHRIGSARPASGSRRFSSGDQSHRVYVGNLSYEVAWQDLKDHMKQAGDVVHAEVMTDSHTGRSKGCGIVEFRSKQDADAAIETLTNSELYGRTIFVREDREMSTAKTGSADGSRETGYRNSNPSVYVWNLSTETSWQDLKDHMRRAGNVDSATIFTKNHDELNAGIVVYQRPQDAARAIRELQGTELHGMPLNLREDRMPSGSSGRGTSGRRGDGSHGAGRGRGGRGEGRGRAFAGGRVESVPDERVVVVSNLASATTWRELKDHFRECGDVRRVNVGFDGTGIVSFGCKEDAATAVDAMNGSELQGSIIEVHHR
ncbi:eukaryotic translation initiation factor 4H [Mayamaea pseudoterrestris]|nr:eukaryotic translation initiation factor 4H [Mayamaea pseudoterrestris]